jgi:outer membrane receptor protein involved in Fe transport
MRVLITISAIGLVLASLPVSGDPVAVNAESEGPATSSGSPASSSAGEAGPLGQVVVTAQKYTQPAYNVPISLDVISGSALQQMGNNSLDTLQFQVPGLTVQASDVERRIIIGGVANIDGNGGLVGIYIDDADVTASPSQYGYNSLDVRTYDLARVEVLRGPQGTLYGEGSVGGAVHFVTNQPVLDATDFGIRSETLFTKGGQPSEHVFPVINIPLVSGRLGIRVSGEYDHDGGWVDLPSASQRNINPTDLSDTRIEALWQASPRFTASALEIIHRKSYVNTQGEDTAGDLEQPFNLATVPSGRDHYDLSAITLQYDLAQAGKLVSATNYYKDDNQAILPASTNLFGPPPAPRFQAVDYPDKYVYAALTEELRLTQAGLGPWSWTIGGIYKRVRTNNLQTHTIFDLALPPQQYGLTLQQLLGEPGLITIPFGVYLASNSSAEFADLSYNIADRLTIGAGVRHFRDDESTFGQGAPFQEGRFTSTDPRVYVLYQATRYINLYANAAKGFRSGGFNSFGVPPFGPESLWRYEVGAKTRQIRGFSATADVNYSNYSNYQTQGVIVVGGSPQGAVVNGGTVHIKGVEATLAWSPDGYWTFRLGGDYVNAKFVKVPATADTTHYAGDPVDEVPRYQMDASIERDFRVSGRPVFVRTDYMQRAKQSYRNRSVGPWYYAYSSDLYFLNLEAGVRWNDNLRMGVMGQNLLNDRGAIDPFVNENGPLRPRPLTVGFYFDATF